MFGLAEDMLRQAGMEFRDVVRTWIYLREMDRDYADLNRARREFFTSRGIQPVPASTAIGGAPVSARHDLSLGIYALRGTGPVERTVMTSPTLNEAPEYGADFVRGLRIADSNKITLIVSGTASVDEAGATAHVDDFTAQVERMLLNLSALLARQGAGFGDVVSAITYVKHRRDAVHLRDLFQRAGFEGFPQVFVEADVCRPDLLCETELIAALPGNS
jgi:enamine deaminase RidA (YjgF/YER057c/UK114 family)